MTVRRMPLANLRKIKEKIVLCNTWRITNPTIEDDIFRLNFSTGFIQRKSNYFFISSISTSILIAISTYLFPVLVSVSKEQNN